MEANVVVLCLDDEKDEGCTLAVFKSEPTCDGSGNIGGRRHQVNAPAVSALPSICRWFTAKSTVNSRHLGVARV